MSAVQFNIRVLNSTENHLLVAEACESGTFKHVFSQWDKIPDLPGLLKMLGFEIVVSGDLLSPMVDIVSWEGAENESEEAKALVDSLDKPEKASGTLYRNGDIEYLAQQLTGNGRGLAVDVLMLTNRQFRQSVSDLCSITFQHHVQSQRNLVDALLDVLEDPFSYSQRYPASGDLGAKDIADQVQVLLLAILAGIGRALATEKAQTGREALLQMYERGCFVWLAIYGRDLAGLPMMSIPCVVMMSLVDSDGDIDMGAFSLDNVGF